MIARLHVPAWNDKAPPSLNGEQVRYLAKVLRSRPGDHIRLFCGDGYDSVFEIKALEGKTVRLEFVERIAMNADPKTPVTLFQALLKGDKMSEVVRDCTALGVSRIGPCRSDRTVSRTSIQKVARWRKIAGEACRQCGRTILPEIDDSVQNIRQVLRTPESSPQAARFLFWEGEGNRLDDVLNDLSEAPTVSMAVGPEGGWSEEEVSAASEQGWKLVRLGSRILRAELFPTVALSVIQDRLGAL